MISIVIPLYNKEKQILKTLQTVMQQTYQDFEVIIVNDGSTDRSMDEVNKVQDTRIHIFNQQNAGVSAARNRGVREAHGEYIAFLDADDEWEKEYLSTQISLAQKYTQCDVFATNYMFMDDEGKKSPTIIQRIPFRNEDGVLTNYFEVAADSHPPLWTSAIMVRKKAFENVGGFPVGVKSGEDLLTWARLAIEHQIAYTKKVQAAFLCDTRSFTDDQKTREPEKEDLVGKELHQLYIKNKDIVGLKKYNALWHKMRSRIYLEKGYRRLSFSESCLSLKYHFSIKIFVFMVLAACPDMIIKKIFSR